jgi:hypothetical protein
MYFQYGRMIFKISGHFKLNLLRAMISIGHVDILEGRAMLYKSLNKGCDNIC